MKGIYSHLTWEIREKCGEENKKYWLFIHLELTVCDGRGGEFKVVLLRVLLDEPSPPVRFPRQTQCVHREQNKAKLRFGSPNHNVEFLWAGSTL